LVNSSSISLLGYDDGSLQRYGLKLYTEGYSFEDVYKLAGLMHYNFGLFCTVQTKEGKPVIYILHHCRKPFFNVGISLLSPFLYYKLGLKANVYTVSG
jgi:hypothetical protein